MTVSQHRKACEYQAEIDDGEGSLEKVLKPRPSTKSTTICPACFEEVH